MRSSGNDVAGVDFVFEEEGCDSGLGVAVDHRPVDGCGSAVAGQEGGVEIEGAEARHGPDYFRKHAEGYDNEQVGFKRAKFFYEFRIFKSDGLHQMQALGKGEFPDRRLVEFVTASGRLVRHGDHAYHVVAAVYYSPQAFNRKIRGSEEDYSEIIFVME